ncbi:YeiH family protein [Rhodovulum kholense]|uniref:Putative integral membrane protein (TIGR00698 family) n=1 Tax=Rhodovulum kholense TaxID=453584 RepID=A0A8E2VLH4_9RHOB|nr:YeiH family protein [Rhodovulum kholense]PTW50176.1 putative integral membrane protein (TIGR00698 family) [Rhodovulum kholense]
MTDTPLDSAPRGLARIDRAGLLPGLALTGGLALVALGLHRALGIPALSPLVLAMVMGMAIRNGIGPVPLAAPGIAFALKRLLRLAIVLLGFQLTLGQLAAVGPLGLGIVAVTLGSTFVFTKAMARLLGVERRLGELIAAGTSVCGASAVLACNTVTRGSDEDVAYAIACVTVFGSAAMLSFPLIGTALHLTPQAYGLWAGASIHEVAQVVGASFALGDAAGQAGTVAKLSRVILLAPLILTLARVGRWRGHTPADGAAPMPWFVVGFLAMVGVNSVLDLPEAAQHGLALTASFLLTVALAAMGLETDIRKLRRKGLRPLLLGAAASVFVAGLALALVALL